MVALASPSTSTYYWAWSRNLRAAAALPSHTGGRAAFVNVSAGCDSRRKRMSTASPAIEEKADPPASDVLVQYVVLRRDLIDAWPLGSVVTQGCHASVAAIWSHKDDPVTLEYCSPNNLDSMHKVTLQVKGEPQIINLSEKLKAGGIDHKLWVEQPENIPTCLATKPYPKSIVSSYFKKLQLSYSFVLSLCHQHAMFESSIDMGYKFLFLCLDILLVHGGGFKQNVQRGAIQPGSRTNIGSNYSQRCRVRPCLLLSEIIKLGCQIYPNS